MIDLMDHATAEMERKLDEDLQYEYNREKMQMRHRDRDPGEQFACWVMLFTVGYFTIHVAVAFLR